MSNDRKRPPAPWDAPAYQPLHDAMHQARRLAAGVGEAALAEALSSLYGAWTGGRVGEVAPAIADAERVALLAAGHPPRGPLVRALGRAATDPTPESLDEAAGEVVRAWMERRTASPDRAIRLYERIFSGIAQLHPLAACRLGMEVRRRLFVELLAAERIARSGGESAAAREEEALATALLLRLADRLGRTPESTGVAP